MIMCMGAANMLDILNCWGLIVRALCTWTLRREVACLFCPQNTSPFLQVYYVAKQMSRECSAEEYAIALAKFFVKEYPKVSLGTYISGSDQPTPLNCCKCLRLCLCQLDILHLAFDVSRHVPSSDETALHVQITESKVWVEQKPWKRVAMDGEPHDHGAPRFSC